MSEFIPPAKPLIGDDEVAAVTRVLRSGMLAQGPEVAAFEEEFSAHFGLGRACVAVNSGTSGLHLGLLSCGVKAGDEVIVPSFTFAATANSVALTGATPVFADIDADDFCLSPAAVEAAITPRTVGVMPVHLYGHPAKMDAIMAIADKHGIQVFEDAAQAHGATLHGTPVGAFGTFAMFSLYPTKNMTSGEGGMVSTSTAEVERLLRLYRNQGMERQYHNEVVGFNARMTDIHAAIGREQLKKVDGWTRRRQDNAAFLSANLETVTPPPVAAGAVHVYHQYTVRVPEDRDGLAAALREEYQIGSGMFYPVPNHRLAPFQVAADLPETERAAAQCLSLPVHPSVSPADLERIVTAVNALAGAGA
ncbi:MAG: DegT/DnrJ/EryC1/StrS family aminotransferase [Intrasporangium sp.]|uniref:DegT/DnrJ/EryC1/StrS family aminotransferase n=1 Tax=Intrasporangium sp. TaxID=1925024 RepID=UPI0026485447|nr:DegT/DnrJ/EryC1/StrS family aminotransferase [Intrasporangium sp.]MDN5794457.1 DegT/DnrJ/EryC1/StrS family aminotransferase [Intrasporangium sp.]